MTQLIREATLNFSLGEELATATAEPLLDEMIATQDETALSDLLYAWNRKGITTNEIYSIAKILRDRCIKISSRHKTFVDIVGTGGSTAKTFNVSTASA